MEGFKRDLIITLMGVAVGKLLDEEVEAIKRERLLARPESTARSLKERGPGDRPLITSLPQRRGME